MIQVVTLIMGTYRDMSICLLQCVGMTDWYLLCITVNMVEAVISGNYLIITLSLYLTGDCET